MMRGRAADRALAAKRAGRRADAPRRARTTASQSVELPGLEKRPASEAGELREAFAVKAGDPVVAQKVIAAGVALKVALGEQGFATAKVGEQDIVVDHESADRAAGAAGDAGAGGALRRDPRDRQAALLAAPRRPDRPVQARRPLRALARSTICAGR